MVDEFSDSEADGFKGVELRNRSLSTQGKEGDHENRLELQE